MAERNIGFDGGTWLNKPPFKRNSAAELEIETAEGGDFWHQTHYGFEHASGHALLFDMPPVFVAEITFSGCFERKYEQAGLLLWESETRWIRAGVEFADGRANLASVVTNGRSDWAMAPANPADREWRLRFTATPSAVLIHAKGTGGWQILRVANYLVTSGTRLGPMACSPLSGSLTARFSDFRMLDLPSDPLYLD